MVGHLRNIALLLRAQRSGRHKNFGNCCSMVWVHRQGQWKGKYFSLSFSEEAAKKLSGDLRPSSSTFVMFFDLVHACCWT